MATKKSVKTKKIAKAVKSIKKEQKKNSSVLAGINAYNNRLKRQLENRQKLLRDLGV